MDLASVGLWTFALRSLDAPQLADIVAELESLGYGAIWFPGGPAESGFDHAEALLKASRRLVVAPGVISIWSVDADRVAIRSRAIHGSHPDRFLLGLGVSHPEFVNRAAPDRYQRPLTAMTTFLDALDELDPKGGTGAVRRVLAALGPGMLRLSAERTAGAHPYFVPVEHTAAARKVLGPGLLLAPEQAVVLETDPQVAREAARAHMSVYLGLTNYVGNLRRLGFTEEDLSGPTDRLVDAVVAWGDEATIASRVREHLDAGADHVCVQVIARNNDERRTVPTDAWRRLAPALGSMRPS
jgi:probable F420-dependent oxidoreductase